MTSFEKKPLLPVSIDSFERLRERGFYYVDKTLLIRDVVSDSSDALLFTRPRRFGKTTVLSMLQSFFEKTDRDTSVLFHGTNIEKAGAEYMDHQGKYPVIFLSFKDAVGNSSQAILADIHNKIKAEYERHLDDIRESGNRDSTYCSRIERFLSEKPSVDSTTDAVQRLSYYLHRIHGVAPVVLIDEYDTPIRKAWALRRTEPASYETVSSFMRRLLSNTIKGNPNRSYACLTGIERVAKEGGESGLNNLTVYGVLSQRFAEYFGFTHEEVKALLDTYDMSDRYGDICKWYQGYRFGDVEMFNPVSVLTCLHEGGRIGPYWAETSMNDTIGDALDYATPQVVSDMSQLLAPDGTARAAVSDALMYPQLPHNPDAVFTLLLSTGYLTPAREQPPTTIDDKNHGNPELTLEIPNAELRSVYKEKIYDRINDAPSDLRETYARLRDAVSGGDADGMRDAIEEALLLVLGPNDIGGKKKEDAYHMLLTGLLGPLMGSYVLASNGNAGKGRFDIALTPLVLSNPAVVIEVKAGNNESSKKLMELANVAMRQIDEKRYLMNPYWTGVGRILKYGVAFSKKSVQVVFQELTRTR